MFQDIGEHMPMTPAPGTIQIKVIFPPEKKSLDVDWTSKPTSCTESRQDE